MSPDALDRLAATVADLARLVAELRGDATHATAPAVLTSEQAAAYLGKTPVWVERQARAGRLPGFKLGRAWRYRVDELATYIDREAAR
jgi:excisionase family DNA binding protein